MEPIEPIAIHTPYGEARAYVHGAAGAYAALVLGHGAGGGVEARDIQAARRAAHAAGFAAVLVEQPYRVAGRRAPPPPTRLDAAWTAVIERLAAEPLAGLALVFGGRSMGARVACRTAAAAGAIAVLCLAFPLLPPRRARAAREPRSRMAELESVSVPVLVIQGTRDPFGMPVPGPGRTVIEVPGDHSLRGQENAVGVAVGDWLARLSVS